MNGDRVIRESLEIWKELGKIAHLLKVVPEYGSKNELKREREELLKRRDELIWKLYDIHCRNRFLY